MRSPRWPKGHILRECVRRAVCASMWVGSVSSLGFVGSLAACGAADDTDQTTDNSMGGGSNGAANGDGAAAGGNTGASAGGNGATSAGAGDNGNGSNASNGSLEDGGSSAPAQSAEDTFYRADTLKLIKPQLVLKPIIGGQQDITPDAQKAVDEGLKQDKEPDDGDGVADSGDGDGYVDLNAMIRFIGGVDPKQAGGFVTAGAGLCPFPYKADEVCGPLALGPFQQAAEYTNGKDCKLDGADGRAAGACFSSQQGSFTVNIQLIGAVPLQDTQVIGSWVDEGTQGISNGWIRGFLSEEVAKKTKLPEQIPIAARLLLIQPGTPLIEFLADKDKQASPPGWWFTLQYTAKPAVYDPKVGPDGEK